MLTLLPSPKKREKVTHSANDKDLGRSARLLLASLQRFLDGLNQQVLVAVRTFTGKLLAGVCQLPSPVLNSQCGACPNLSLVLHPPIINVGDIPAYPAVHPKANNQSRSQFAMHIKETQASKMAPTSNSPPSIIRQKLQVQKRTTPMRPPAQNLLPTTLLLVAVRKGDMDVLQREILFRQFLQTQDVSVLWRLDPRTFIGESRSNLFRYRGLESIIISRALVGMTLKGI